MPSTQKVWQIWRVFTLAKVIGVELLGKRYSEDALVLYQGSFLGMGNQSQGVFVPEGAVQTVFFLALQYTILGDQGQISLCINELVGLGNFEELFHLLGSQKSVLFQ